MGDETIGLKSQLLVWFSTHALQAGFFHAWTRDHPDFPWTDDEASGRLFVNGVYAPTLPLPGTVSIEGVQTKDGKTTATAKYSGDWAGAGLVEGSAFRVQGVNIFDVTVTSLSSGQCEVEVHGLVVVVDEPSATAVLLQCIVPRAVGHKLADMMIPQHRSDFLDGDRTKWDVPTAAAALTTLQHPITKAPRMLPAKARLAKGAGLDEYRSGRADGTLEDADLVEWIVAIRNHQQHHVCPASV